MKNHNGCCVVSQSCHKAIVLNIITTLFFSSLFWHHSFPLAHHKKKTSLLLQTQNRIPKKEKMVPQVKPFIILLLLLFDLSLISADNNNYNEGMEVSYTTDHKRSKEGKLLREVDVVLDYQEPGANPAHEPHKGGGGGYKGGSP